MTNSIQRIVAASYIAAWIIILMGQAIFAETLILAYGDGAWAMLLVAIGMTAPALTFISMLVELEVNHALRRAIERKDAP